MRKKRTNIFIYILSLRWLLEGMVLFYKKCISPLLPSVCIYYPSCSIYTLDCLRRHGSVKGIFFGIKRIVRCVPWAKGGFDPIPVRKKDYKWLY